MHCRIAQLGGRFVFLLCLCYGVGWARASAQSSAADPAQVNESLSPSTQTGPESPPAQALKPESSDSADALTLFPHSETSRYWISGQANVILQWHPAFPAQYSGPNSLRSPAENATSKVYTLYMGCELTPTTEVYLDAESAGGYGISDALGVAGFTNLDVVRNPTLGAVPYVARAMIRQVIPLSRERAPQERGAETFTLATRFPCAVSKFDSGNSAWRTSSIRTRTDPTATCSS
jgi:high affinity Mn2+ porin